MALSVRNLYQQINQDHLVELVAGRGGLDKMVTWVHLIEDISVSRFLHGYELIFTTGIAESRPDWILSFIQALAAQNVSGLVLNIGPYIHGVPAEVIRYCDENSFPLFTVPWEVKLVDITYDFCHRIITSEERDNTVAQTFKNVIFFPENIRLYRPALERQGFGDQGSYRVAALQSKGRPEDVDLFRKRVRLFLQSALDRFAKKYSLFTVDEMIVLVFLNCEKDIARSVVEGVTRFVETAGEGAALCAGVSDAQTGLEGVARLYRNAESALRIALRGAEPVRWYADLGLYKVLLSVEDHSVLEELYNDSLRPLVKYDQEHRTDYVQVLKCYLDNDASVQSVAKTTYLHRNTINYKIRRIKEILNCDLTQEDKLRITLAFSIHELMS